MKIKSLVSLSVLILGLIVASFSPTHVQAETGDATSSASAAVPITPPQINLEPLKNHAAIVAEMFKRINGVRVTVKAGSGVENYDNSRVYQFTNEIKTVSAIMAVITTDWWYSEVTNPDDWISIHVQFYDSSDASAIYNGSAHLLFEGWGGGTPIKGNYGGWTLPSWATEISMYASPTYLIPVEGLIDARLITRDQYGNPQGRQLNVNNGFLEFPTDGTTGELILTTAVLSPEGYYIWSRRAYNIATGVEIQLTFVQWQITLRDSEDFITVKNYDSLDRYVYSYQGYGKVPLLIVETTVERKNVLLSVHTDDDHATSFELEDQSTKVKTTIVVPDGQTGVKINLSSGTWYIVPKGLKLRSWNEYGGGKG